MVLRREGAVEASDREQADNARAFYGRIQRIHRSSDTNENRMAREKLAAEISDAGKDGKLGSWAADLLQYLRFFTPSGGMETLAEETGDPLLPKLEKSRVVETSGNGHEQGLQQRTRHAFWQRLRHPLGGGNGHASEQTR